MFRVRVDSNHEFIVGQEFIKSVSTYNETPPSAIFGATTDLTAAEFDDLLACCGVPSAVVDLPTGGIWIPQGPPMPIYGGVWSRVLELLPAPTP